MTLPWSEDIYTSATEAKECKGAIFDNDVFNELAEIPTLSTAYPVSRIHRETPVATAGTRACHVERLCLMSR